MNLTDEHVEMIVEQAETLARDVPVGDPLEEAIYATHKNVVRLAEQYRELLSDAAVIVKENHRLRKLMEADGIEEAGGRV